MVKMIMHKLTGKRSKYQNEVVELPQLNGAGKRCRQAGIDLGSGGWKAKAQSNIDDLPTEWRKGGWFMYRQDD